MRRNSPKRQALQGKEPLERKAFYFNELFGAPENQAAGSFFSCAARRDTLREPVFLCTTPLPTARINSDWATTNAALASALSPAATASSNLRTKVRTRLRRALLTSVRRAI